MLVRRYTFHIVWLLLSVAAVCAVFAGPIWGYPIALFLAYVFSMVVTCYPTDSSLRRTLAVIGVIVFAGGVTGLFSVGFNPVTRHGSLPLILLGAACIASAMFPWYEIDSPATTDDDTRIS